MNVTIRTVEAVYERGYLRPLEPIEEREGLIFIVNVLDLKAGESINPRRSVRGKYRGILSTSEEFARNKSLEKTLEHL